MTANKNDDIRWNKHLTNEKSIHASIKNQQRGVQNYPLQIRCADAMIENLDILFNRIRHNFDEFSGQIENLGNEGLMDEYYEELNLARMVLGENLFALNKKIIDNKSLLEAYSVHLQRRI